MGERVHDRRLMQRGTGDKDTIPKLIRFSDIWPEEVPKSNGIVTSLVWVG
jgi:hypothetical protein